MYSQASQDDFVNLVLNNQQQGYFVDVGGGCADLKTESNSLLFEELGWKGLVVDADKSRFFNRTCSFEQAFVGDGNNGTQKLGNILEKHKVPKIVDYLSIDIDGPDFDAVKSFIESEYSFKVATIEHSIYSQNPGVYELKMNTFMLLSSCGYVRIVDNAGHRATLNNLHAGWPFEDWYINPKFVNYQEIIKKIREAKETN
jgi:hypothetical protein